MSEKIGVDPASKPAGNTGKMAQPPMGPESDNSGVTVGRVAGTKGGVPHGPEDPPGGFRMPGNARSGRV